MSVIISSDRVETKPKEEQKETPKKSRKPTK